MSERDVEKIFNDALDCDPQERDAFLEKRDRDFSRFPWHF